MTSQLLIHSHKGEDGANVLVAANPGDTVRRRGYRRHWVIVSAAGQLVGLVAKHGKRGAASNRATSHADELEMIMPAGQGGTQ